MKKSEYQIRLERHFDELKWLYCELYENRMDAFEQLCTMMQSAYRQRSVDLKEMDHSREENPGWYHSRSLMGMMLYTSQFAKNLKGVREKLDYLEECGVNYLHLMPLLESPKGKSDGGYAVSDFRRVQPELGTMRDLRALTAACHKKDISVCLDFVMNHTSEEHAWAKKAKAGEKEYQDRYFFFDNWELPNEYEKTVPQVFPTVAPGNFSWVPECEKVVMTSFYPYQWDLNYRNPAVFNEMTANLLYLANQGIDVLRIDAVPYIWKQLGTDCRNLPQVHTIVRMLRMITEIVCPGVILLGEVVMEPVKVAPYFGTAQKPECHILYNVTTMCTLWHTVATADTRLLRHQLKQTAGLSTDFQFQNYLRCHDDIGWGLDYTFLRQFGMEEVPHKKYLNDYFTGKFPGSLSKGELYNDDPRLGDARLCATAASLCGIEEAVRQYEQNPSAETKKQLQRCQQLDQMLHAFIYSLSGIPVLYSGDEVSQFNDMSYHEDPEKAADSRYLHRGSFDWEAAEGRKDGKTPAGALFLHLNKLVKLRGSYQAFDADAAVTVYDSPDPQLLIVERSKNGQKWIGIYNFSAQEKKEYAPETYLDIYKDEPVKQGELVVEPYGFYWLIRE